MLKSKMAKWLSLLLFFTLLTASFTAINAAGSDSESSTFGEVVRIDASSHPYSGAWRSSTQTPFFRFNTSGWWSDNWSWMYINVDTNKGGAVEFSFTGTSIALYLDRFALGSKAYIYVDGVLITTVDTYRPKSEGERETSKVFEKNDLPRGVHVIKVEEAGKSFAESAYLLISGFEYTPCELPVISVLSPTYYMDINEESIEVEFQAPGFTLAKAYSLHAPDSINSNPYGHMKEVASDISLDPEQSGRGIFTFNAADFPYGPASIHITAWNEQGEADDCYLQLFNNVGNKWFGGAGNTIKTIPQAIEGMGMEQVFLEEFTEMPVITYTGNGEDVKYAAAKPDSVNWPEYGSAKFAPPGYSYGTAINNYSPFEIAGNDYMKIETKDWKTAAEPNWGISYTTGFLSSMGRDGSGFVTQPGAAQYFETRLFLPPNPGLWPAFWTLSPNDPDGRPGNDELDVLEAYMGGINDEITYNHHTWGDGYGGIHAGGIANTADFGNGIDLSEGWHTYGMLITEDYTTYYFDDEYIKGSAHETLNRSWTIGNYFMVNNAFRKEDALKFAGGFGRYGDTAEMYVDWVRVFQVQNDGFTPLLSKIKVTPGNTAEIQILKNGDAVNASGTYEIDLPAGWTVVSGQSFTPGSKDTVVLNVPADFGEFQGTISITPITEGISIAPLDISFTTLGLYSTEISPSLNEYGDGYVLNLKYQNNSASTLNNILVTAQGPEGWTESKTIPVLTTGESADVTFAAPVLDPYITETFTFNIKLAEDYTVTINRPISGLTAAKSEIPITIDGTIHEEEWVDTMTFTLGEEARSSAAWTGPDDLRVTGKVKWDDNYLYIAAEVKDDVHFMDKNTIVEAWAGDSIQISLDPARTEGIVSAGPHLSFTTALNSVTGEYGIAVDRSDYPELGLIFRQLLTQSVSSVVRDEVNKTTTYTLAFDWDEILPEAYAGTRNIGISMVINDSDGAGRKGWISYMGGIATGKDPMQFGDLILDDGIRTQPPDEDTISSCDLTVELIQKIEDMDIHKGTKNSLSSKLKNVLESLVKGTKDKSVVNKLNAFIHEVNAQKGKKLTFEQADELRMQAENIINKI